LAPSIAALSYGSIGIAASPPSTISMTRGVHCQVSTRTSEGMTVAGWNTQAKGPIPTKDKR
jgi:hypothetical protein